MKLKCYIDKNIILSNENLQIVKEKDIELIEYDKDKIEPKEIEYLLLHSPLADDEIMKMDNCKYIGIRARNTDYVNKNITKAMNIQVEGLQKQHAVNAVAEHTFSLIFGITKNIINSNKNVIEGRWKENIGLNYEVSGKKLGIVGYGQIGKRVAEIGELLGMEILIAGKKKDDIREGELNIETVLKESDIITLHLSSKKENEKYINAECLSMMKDDSILINTARGSVIDYDALEKELEKGKFLGIGLDVFPNEPLLKSSLFQHSNVIFTPHVGYLTKESIERMNQELIINFINYINL